MVLIQELLSRLHSCQIEFVIIGGVAVMMRGSALATEDLDVCVVMTPENLAKIVQALHGLDPRFRFTPQKIPLPDDPVRLHGYKNLNLITTYGPIDFLTEVSGVGTYEEAYRLSTPMTLMGMSCQVLNLDALIASKRAAGREKDRRAVVELEVIRRKLAEKNPSVKP